jgi:hypothetical protein
MLTADAATESPKEIRVSPLGLLSRGEAARVCRLSLQTFDKYVRPFLTPRMVGERRIAFSLAEIETHLKGTRWEPPQSGGVYAIRGASGYIKIGRADKNIATRMAGLQTSQPETLELVAVLSFDPNDERKFHEMFKRCRRRGEWFKPDIKMEVELRNLNLLAKEQT